MPTDEIQAADAADDLTGDEAMAELIDDLEGLEESADSHDERRVLRRTIHTLDRITRGRIFGVDDLAQQIVGGFLLSGAFVVTEEVWQLAAGMDRFRWGLTVAIVLGIGYAALYRAADEHDAEAEEVIGWLPQRFVSLVLIAYLSVAILAFVLGAPATFDASTTTTMKAISIGAIFSVVGAATADSIL